MGGFAMAALLLAALILPAEQHLRMRALVLPARSVVLVEGGVGQYSWTLWDGRPARGPGVLRQQVLRYERDDRVELALAHGLHTGDTVEVGQELVSIHSPRNARRLAELEAEHEALTAERALLAAGGRSEEVSAAAARLRLAEARLTATQQDLSRITALASQGAASSASLETAQMEERVREQQVSVARAALSVVRSSARPEALQHLDAQLTAAAAGVDELRILLAADRLSSPIRGEVVVGDRESMLKVQDIDTVYLQLPVPEEYLHRLPKGATFTFTSRSVPDQPFAATLVDVALDAQGLGGRQVFMASARVDNPDHLLRPGMSGEVVLPLDEGAGHILASVWDRVVSP